MDGYIQALVRLGEAADKIAAIESERDAYKAQANLFKHMVITCGVAATHPDANLTRTGAYAEEWNSAQAEQVRTLRAERDALRKSVDQLADTLKNVHEAVCETLGIEGDDALPELVADWAESDLDALLADAARFRWLVAEHDRVDPKAAVVWKAGFKRDSHEWVNTINGRDLVQTIDAEAQS